MSDAPRPKSAAKKQITVPPIASSDSLDAMQMTAGDLLAMTRHEHQTRLAQLNLKLAQAQAKAVRLETEQATRSATAGIMRCQLEADAALQQQRVFAQDLAKRYDFDWMTHVYCNDTGIIRRIPGE